MLTMNLRLALGSVIRALRRARGLTQESFDVVSSRTYLSTIERGLKCPTVEKLDELAGVLGVHPVALLGVVYATQHHGDASAFFERLHAESTELLRLVELEQQVK